MFPQEQQQPQPERYLPEQLRLIQCARELLNAADHYANREEYRGLRATTLREKMQLFGAFVLGSRSYPDTGDPAEFPSLNWKHTERVNICSVRVRNLPLNVSGIWRELRYETITNLEAHETTQVLLMQTRGDSISTLDASIEVIDDVSNLLQPTDDTELIGTLQAELDAALAHPYRNSPQP